MHCIYILCIVHIYYYLLYQKCILVQIALVTTLLNNPFYMSHSSTFWHHQSPSFLHSLRSAYRIWMLCDWKYLLCALLMQFTYMLQYQYFHIKHTPFYYFATFRCRLRSKSLQADYIVSFEFPNITCCRAIIDTSFVFICNICIIFKYMIRIINVEQLMYTGCKIIV